MYGKESYPECASSDGKDLTERNLVRRSASFVAQAAARVESEIVLTRVLKAELKDEDTGYERVQKHLRKGTASGAALEGSSVAAERLQSLRTKMHEAFR